LKLLSNIKVFERVVKGKMSLSERREKEDVRRKRKKKQEKEKTKTASSPCEFKGIPLVK
jgi:predicted RNA-binding protein with RPS1 domain